jgi:hypothetical protein
MPQITRIVWEGREAEKGSPLPHIKTTRSSSLSRDLRQFSTSLPSSLNLPQIFSSRSPIATPPPLHDRRVTDARGRVTTPVSSLMATQSVNLSTKSELQPLPVNRLSRGQ